MLITAVSFYITVRLYNTGQTSLKIIRSILVSCVPGYVASEVSVERKGKVDPRTDHECPEGEQRYSSILSLTLALDEGGWSTPRPGRFTPGKETRYPLYRRLDGSQGRFGRVRKTSPPLGFDPRTVQPVASRYTDYAIPAHFNRTCPVQDLKARGPGTLEDKVTCSLETLDTNYLARQCHLLEDRNPVLCVYRCKTSKLALKIRWKENGSELKMLLYAFHSNRIFLSS
jgi:hypothetical protein